jgi:hypothetical protein
MRRRDPFLLQILKDPLYIDIGSLTICKIILFEEKGFFWGGKICTIRPKLIEEYLKIEDNMVLKNENLIVDFNMFEKD